MEKKRVVIVGAGVSGLTVCKHLLELGCQPIVFEADTMLGGVWARALACTKLQTPRTMYQYSDFPWPETVTEEFPSHRQVVAYLDAYARHFGVLGCVRFGHRVVGMEYHGVGEQDMAAWEEWAGNGQAFGSGAGEWRLSVADADGHVETHKADFVALCIGRFSGVPNIPTFPAGKGPEVFDGQVIHSMDYAKMGTSKAKEMIRGKRVTVVGYMKSALDIATECAEVNGTAHPCTMVVRTKHWILPNYSVWGVDGSKFFLNRFAELLVHKPGEDLLLSILATLLTPLRWAFHKLAESYYSIPMRKHGMVPDHSLFEAMASTTISITPKDHYKRLEEGSIVIKKCKTFSFCKEGVLMEGELSPVKSDVVIFGTGFKGDQKIKDMFTSKYFRSVADHYKRLEEGSIVIKKCKTFSFCKEGVLMEGELSPVKSDVVIFGTGFKGDQKIKDMFTSKYFRSVAVGSESTTVPLYRECINPKIPQLAVIGYSETLSNMYVSDIRAKWLACFLDGGFKLPNVAAMQKDVLEWEKYMKRYCGRYFRRSSIMILNTWYNDQLCRDMGCNPRRKKGFFSELFEVYGPGDYANLLSNYKSKEHKNL